MPARRLARRVHRLVPGKPQIGVRRTPVSRNWGYDRGTPVDRFYLDGWLDAHRGDVRGRVLDIGDDDHARRFGGAGVERIDVLHPQAGAPGATVTGDLETGAGLPDRAFDCFLLLETLVVLYDLRRAVQSAYDLLAPGGVVLASGNGIAPIETGWTDFWRVTPNSMHRLFAERFGAENVQLASYGNVLSASAYLYGVAAEELRAGDLARHDERYPVTVAVRARRPAG